jgi:hypothetical protein
VPIWETLLRAFSLPSPCSERLSEANGEPDRLGRVEDREEEKRECVQQR